VAASPDLDPSYDLVHVRARAWSEERPRTAALLELDFDFRGEHLDLEAARSRRRALDRHGISVLIIPARYREPTVTVAEAERRAVEAVGYEETQDQPGSPGRPRLHAEHPMFYVFRAASPSGEEGDGTAHTGGGVSSGRLVSVDRCDGHLWTEEEKGEYFSLIGAR
jgi:hypothetical protein